MKNILIFFLFSIFILSSCKKDSNNPVNTDNAPSAPALLLPADSATGVAVPATFSWKAVANADSFTLQVSLNSSFNNPVFNKSGLTLQSQEVTGLSNLTVYYWRVKAINKFGSSEWSTTRRLSTSGPLPGIPTLLSPVNNAANVSMDPTLHWNAGSGASSYTLQISNDSSFTNYIYNQSGLTGTSQQIPNLNYSTLYYWHVKAYNSYGTSAFSNIWNFTTIADTTFCPGIPTITYGGRIYHTVKIDAQCWLKENLNIGIMISGAQNQSDNNLIEKYCYNNDSANCSAYGGLYQWNEAMQYLLVGVNVQGICPYGWHIPDKTEYSTLAAVVNNDGDALKAIGQGSGLGTGTNTSGFSALLGGYRSTNQTFINVGAGTYYWTAIQSASPNAFNMYLNNSTSNILILGYYDENSGFSIRCLMN